MKKLIILLIVASALCASALDPKTRTKVLNGEEASNWITYYASATVRYIAESAKGAVTTNAEWRCTKVVASGTSFPYSETGTVLKYLAAPHDGGTNLPALFGD